MSPPAVLVIAKAPVAGRVKTRLVPPLSHEQAAALAQAALCDTLAAVLQTDAPRRVLLLDGEPGPWLPPGFELEPQQGDGLAERIAAGFAVADGPALMIGMDTPQVTPALLSAAGDALALPGTDAVLGPTDDGGYWCVGLRRPDARVFAGVPMSEPTTGAAQRARFAQLGLRCATLPALRDVDAIADAHAVAAAVPGSRFAAAVAALAL